MVDLVCEECGAELETVMVTRPLPDGGRIRRERTHCPACDFGVESEAPRRVERTVSPGER